MSEKYGVVTELPEEGDASLHGKAAGVDLPLRCPRCQSPLDADPRRLTSTATYACPKCGTAPFER